MADEVSEHELEQARLLVLAAIAASPPMGNNAKAWLGQVAAALPEVYIAMNEGGRAMSRALMFVRAGTPFWGKYRGYDVEESSQRLVVRFDHEKDKDHPDGFETIRTDRIDTVPGKRMMAKLDDVRIGTTLIVHKLMEPMRNQQGRFVRILGNFEVAPKAFQDAEAEAAQGTPPAPAPPTRSDPPAGDSAPQPGGSTPIEHEDLLREANDLLDELHYDVKGKQRLIGLALHSELWPPTPKTISTLVRLIHDERPF